VNLVLEDLAATSPRGKKTRLHELILAKGGRYRSPDKMDSVIFNVYTNVAFKSLAADRRGVTVLMSFDTPPGGARDANPAARHLFWEGKSGKRLMNGGLVAFIWGKGNQAVVHLGIIASGASDLAESSKQNAKRVEIQVAFFEPHLELRILDVLTASKTTQTDDKLLIEAPVMFEAIRPFLEALRVEPTRVPFSRYLCHPASGSLSTLMISPPRYATTPGFVFRLECLFPSDAPVRNLRLSVDDPVSVAAARRQLKNGSRLDATQADAVVDSLVREVALIQG
jgi:hypothetical protein